MNVTLEYCIVSRRALLCKLLLLYDVEIWVKLTLQDLRTPRTILK